MKKILLVDRDGTLLLEPPETFQVNEIAEIELVPGVISALKNFKNAGFEIYIVTNQDGLGTDQNSRENYENINQFLFKIFRSEGISFAGIFECPHYPEDECACRKPKTGILGDFESVVHKNKESTFMVGDRKTDIDFADNLGIKGFLLGEDLSWENIENQVLTPNRSASVKRHTKEVEIDITLNLDGSGKHSCKTGLNFFDHMLDQLGKHGFFDLDLVCKGDLHIDEHHTIEDTGIALGEAFKEALGNKVGIERYAWERILVMDEARTEVSLDFSGRGICEVEVEFKRKYVGDFPTEMFAHFWDSFARAAGLNLHIVIHGDNAHHQIECAFKGIARCLREATRITHNQVSSTKGIL